MYKCLECGHIFETPHEYKERHGLEYGFERMTCCPNCGGGYEEAALCEGCDELFAESELEYGLCPDCREEDDVDEVH